MKIPALAGICLLVCTATAGTQEKKKEVRLRAAYAAGDRFSLHRVERTEGKTQVTPPGQEIVREHPLASFEEVLTRNKVLRADEGRITRLEKRFDKSRYEGRLFGAEQVEKGRSALEGKTIVLVHDGEETSVEKADKIPADELAGITLDPDPLVESLPADPVTSGGAWEVKRELLEKFIGKGDPGLSITQASAECRFEKVETRGGANCAVVRVTIKVEAKGEEEFKMSTQLKGTLWIAIAEKRYAGQEFEGTFETSGVDKVQGRIRSFGKVTIRETIAYEN